MEVRVMHPLHVTEVYRPRPELCAGSPARSVSTIAPRIRLFDTVLSHGMTYSPLL